MSNNNKFRFCQATKCLNSTLKRTDLAFFPFPADKERQEVWLALCGRHDLISKRIKSIYLCAEHFEEDQFEDDEGTILRNNAVPTIFPFATSPRDTSSPTDWGSSVLPADIIEFDPNQQNQADSSQGIAVQLQDDGPIITNIVGAATTTGATTGGEKSYFISLPQSFYTTAMTTGNTDGSGTSATVPPGYIVRLNEDQVLSYEKRKESPEELSETAKKLKTATQVKHSAHKPLILQSKRSSKLSALAKSSTLVTYASVNKNRNSSNLTTDGEVPLLNSPALIRGVAAPTAQQVSSKMASKEMPFVLQPRNITGNKKLCVVQVAPDLPIQAHATEPVHFSWETLIPTGWQDWPVPTEVFLASAVQLKNNYLKIFPRRDRLDIETTLHLAANYNTLTKTSKAHVRARVHHFLKLLQIEKLKQMKEINAGTEN